MAGQRQFGRLRVNLRPRQALLSRFKRHRFVQTAKPSPPRITVRRLKKLIRAFQSRAFQSRAFARFCRLSFFGDGGFPRTVRPWDLSTFWGLRERLFFDGRSGFCRNRRLEEPFKCIDQILNKDIGRLAAERARLLGVLVHRGRDKP